MTTTNNPHYVTPEEADKMKCPMTFNSITTTNHYRCLGPECMAWRWKHVVTTEKINGFEIETVDSSTTHGYCGMVRS